MTRRAAGKSGRVLSLNQYIHRTTLGLPRAERLDAAAELRAHLLERVAELEKKGFAREEAEFLAVRAMGDPAPINRGLLGHAFTARLGWSMLALALLGGGGWWAANNLMPPKEGVAYTGSDLTLEDLRALQADTNAPKGTYQTATLTYPKETKAIYYLRVTPSTFDVGLKDLVQENGVNLTGRWPGSYRYQERILITEQQGSKDCPQDWSLYANWQVLPSRFWNGKSLSTIGPGVGTSTLSGKEICTGLKRQYIQRPLSAPGQGRQTYPVELLPAMAGIITGNASSQSLQALALNHWTVLHQLDLNPRTAANGTPSLKRKASGLYIAVLASDRAAPPDTAGAHWARDAQSRVHSLSYGSQPLPDPPAPDWEHAPQTTFWH